MRELLSKSIAAGLSAGVVLLWWPVLFDRVDTVASWLVRGVTWTALFELLLLALVPFERALWETPRGERLSGRFGAAHSRLHSGSRGRKLSRLSALASAAVIVTVALLVTGLHQGAAQAKTSAGQTTAPVKRIKVVRVTKIVKIVKPRPVLPLGP